MYLWKYWRESRIILGFGVLVVAVFFVLIFRERINPHQQADIRGLWGFLVAALYTQAVLFGLWAWAFGSLGTGRDLGEKSGSFLLTRPKKRAYFVWIDWLCGLGSLLLLVVLGTLALWYQMSRVISRLSIPFDGYIQFPNMTMRLPWAFALIGFAVFLTIALIFSVVYLGTIAMRNSRGALLGGGGIIGYLAARPIVHHYFPSVTLPNLVPPVFQSKVPNMHGIMFTDINHSLVLTFTVRTAILLLFPVAAQFLIERYDI